MAANGSASATLTAIFCTSGGTGVAGQTVTVTQNGQSTITPTSQVTGSNGQVKFTVKDRTAETVTYQAVDTTASPNVTGAASATVVFFGSPATHCAGAVGASSISVSATTAPVSSSTGPTLTGVFCDSNGNPVVNMPFTVNQVVSGGGSGHSKITCPSTSTDNSGKISCSLSDTTAEKVTYSVTVDGSTIGSVTVTYTAGPAVAACGGSSSVLSPSSQTVYTSNWWNQYSGSTATITGSFCDQYGNPVSGQAFSISQSGRSNGTGDASSSISCPRPQVTDANGSFTCTATDQNAETVYYFVTLGGTTYGPVKVTFQNSWWNWNG